jgi:hypothetical protein
MERQFYSVLIVITITLIAIGLVFGVGVLTTIGIAVAIAGGILGLLAVISKARSKKTSFLEIRKVILR